MGETNKNIKNDCIQQIIKAKKIVSNQLFNKFINHLQPQQIGQIIDLTKYLNQSPKQTKNKQNNTVSTQTNHQILEVEELNHLDLIISSKNNQEDNNNKA